MMSNRNETDEGSLLAEPVDFSLCLGGPLYQLLRRVHLSGDVLQLLWRRVVALAVVAWVPLLALSAAEGNAWGSGVSLPFLCDVEVHVRFLIALPLLVYAELLVHQRMRPVVHLFLERGLVAEAAKPRFREAVAAAMRLRNSVPAELLLIALEYGVGVLFVWRSTVALDMTSWYGAGLGGKLQPSLAGWWLGCVSLPIFQFLLIRWYFRLFIWARFLWRVSRLELSLLPTHPDRCGGLGFLSGVTSAFAPVLFAQGTLLAGVMAAKIFYLGVKLDAFKLEVVGLTAFMVFAVLGPLLVFLPQLAAAKREGTREYGTLAMRYARDFDSKWVRGGAAADEPLLGSADIQSLADLGNSFAVVKEMRVAPFTLQTVLQLAVTTLLPVAPLLLTIFPLEELLDRLLKLLF
jgi:hypothetical protein